MTYLVIVFFYLADNHYFVQGAVTDKYFQIINVMSNLTSIIPTYNIDLNYYSNHVRFVEVVLELCSKKGAP